MSIWKENFQKLLFVSFVHTKIKPSLSIKKLTFVFRSFLGHGKNKNMEFSSAGVFAFQSNHCRLFLKREIYLNPFYLMDFPFRFSSFLNSIF